eukprot:430730_1
MAYAYQRMSSNCQYFKYYQSSRWYIKPLEVCSVSYSCGDGAGYKYVVYPIHVAMALDTNMCAVMALLILESFRIITAIPIVQEISPHPTMSPVPPLPTLNRLIARKAISHYVI